MLINSIPKISNIKNNPHQNLNFDGKFYAMTDTHGRTNKVAGVLSEIEKRCSDKKSATFIDGGDFAQESYSLKSIMGVYSKFAESNPHIKTIFNLGNCEIFDFATKNEQFSEYTKQLKDNGIELISATMKMLAKKFNKNADNIKAYTIVNDEGQKVFVTGISIADNITIKEQKKALKEIVAPAIKKEAPDKIILLSHNHIKETENLAKYMKINLGVKNLELILGGHPHTLEDETQDITRILYPPSQGKGALEINLTKKGFEFPKMEIYRTDKHNHDALSENGSQVIKNHNIDNLIPVHPDYQKIMDTQETHEINPINIKSVVTLGYRKPGINASEASELGTFLSNAIKKETNSDIGILFAMDLREKLPQKGSSIKLGHIKDTLNVNKTIYTMQVTANQLVDIFEVSLKEQHKKSTNGKFLEFSDNIKIERFINRTEEKPKIKQLSIKDKEGNWHALLEEKTYQIKDEFKTKKYKLATCEFLAKGGDERRPELKIFQTCSQIFPSENLTTQSIFIKALKDIENNPNFKPKKSEIIDDLS